MSSLLIIIPSIVEPRGIDGLAAIGIPLIPLPPPIGIPEGMGMEDAPPVVIPLIMCAVGRAAGSCQRSSQLVMTVISGPCAFSIWVASCLTWGEEALVAARRAISIACRWCAIMCCTKVTSAALWSEPPAEGPSAFAAPLQAANVMAASAAATIAKWCF